jgi:hypothetical protein
MFNHVQIQSKTSVRNLEFLDRASLIRDKMRRVTGKFRQQCSRLLTNRKSSPPTAGPGVPCAVAGLPRDRQQLSQGKGRRSLRQHPLDPRDRSPTQSPNH